MTKYSPPPGYTLGNQPYSRFGYDGTLYLPARFGKVSALLPSVVSVPPAPPSRLSFASLSNSWYQVAQTDIGLLYGTVMKVTAGNTSTSTAALTGSILGVPVPIWFKSNNTLSIGSGASFNIYYDGAGTTPAMTGVVPSVGIPVALTGAGLGMFLTWTSGTSVTGDSWKACAAGMTDGSGNLLNYTSLTPSAQPLITAGVNGCPGLLFDGVDDIMTSLCNLPAPGTTPWVGTMVVKRPTTAAGNARMVSDGADSTDILLSGATTMTLFNGTLGPVGTGLPTSTFGAVDYKYSNSAADYIHCGSGPIVSGAGAGNSVSNGRTISGAAAPANIEVLQVGYIPASAFDAAAYRARVTAIYGGTVNV